MHQSHPAALKKRGGCHVRKKYLQTQNYHVKIQQGVNTGITQYYYILNTQWRLFLVADAYITLQNPYTGLIWHHMSFVPGTQQMSDLMY